MEDHPFGRAPCPKVTGSGCFDPSDSDKAFPHEAMEVTEVDAVLASGGIPKSKVLRIKGAICDDQLMTKWLKVKTIR